MNEKKYTLLTPSARSAFDDMMIEYRDALLNKASDIAKQNKTGEVEISLRDVVQARNSLTVAGGEIVGLRRRERMATTALLGGFSYVFLGLLFFFVLHGTPQLSRGWLFNYLWMIIIIVGMILMLFPLIFNLKRMARHRIVQDAENDYANLYSPNMIVKMWSMIEKKGKELMKLRGINPDDNFSFISVYEFLEHELISREYIDLLRNVFMARNNIVHSKEFEMKNEDLSEILNQSQRIITELDKRIEELKVIG